MSKLIKITLKKSDNIKIDNTNDNIKSDNIKINKSDIKLGKCIYLTTNGNKCNCNATENNACDKHQALAFLDHVKTLNNKKVCYNYNRGNCKNILDINDKSKCESCLQKDRDKDKLRRSNIAKLNEDREDKTHKICYDCKRNLEIELFYNKVLKSKEEKRCLECRQKDEIINYNRNHNNEKRIEWNKKYEKLDYVKQKRIEWKKNNKELINAYERNRRANSEIFRYNNMIYARKYRKEHPEYVKKMTMRYNTIPKYKYEQIINSTKHKILKLKNKNKAYSKYNFNLSNDDTIKLFNDNCYYCNTKEDNYLNGIDRFVNNIGYEKYNCVSCCKTCNYIKHVNDPFIFIYTVNQILIFNNIINGTINNITKDYISLKFNRYKNRANNKNINFEISSDIYNDIIKKDCYICGKLSTESNKNGLDRYDNTKGYLIDNIRPCCYTCNIFKLIKVEFCKLR